MIKKNPGWNGGLGFSSVGISLGVGLMSFVDPINDLVPDVCVWVDFLAGGSEVAVESSMLL